MKAHWKTAMRKFGIAPPTPTLSVLVCFVVFLMAGGGLLKGQANPALVPASAPLLDHVRSSALLDGSWRFRVGDDPAWADPNFKDDAWEKVTLATPLNEQGIDGYSGYAWYRLHISSQQLAAMGSPPYGILISSKSVGQLAVYVNGMEAGRTRGMNARPALYLSPPLAVDLPAGNGDIVLAVRTWASIPINHGLLDAVQLGSRAEIQEKLELAINRQWDTHALSPILAGFLFFCVAGLGATLYFAQRNHAEYFWLALLCLSVALRAALEAAWGLAFLSLSIFNLIGNWTGWLFMATTLEFVLRFTGGRYRKVVRGVQIGALLVPIFLIFHFDPVSEYVTIAVQIVFCAVVAFMLFRAWRAGQREAGVMLFPFFLAASGDSSDTLLQFAVQNHILSASFAPQAHHLGPIQYSNSTLSYLVFLASLLAVILFRFVRVSQEEQRSAAELDAARSVQAMLIPTELPSSHNFVLESAYYPARGVGGDFFQALPLKDDSMLIVVGDVSGKGLQAAMNASTLVGALRNELAHEPAVVLSHLNQVLLGASGTSLSAVAGFATCLCARIYPTGTMTIANAGHLSPYRDGRELELAASLPLGILPHLEFEQVTVHLKPGDRLTFLSDGVVEAANTKGELFGFERTQQVANEPARYIAQTAQRFGQNDDITVVTLYFAAATQPRHEKQSLHVR
jgi:sigma-B regulation protein RsbU (phosphoserine phosphatase)